MIISVTWTRHNRMNDIVKNIRDFSDAHGLIDRGDRILLSLSAGKDSMLLLDIMLKLRMEYDIDFGIFHLNHMMRGDDAGRDEGHISGLCERLGLPLHLERYDFNAMGHRGSSFEEAARDTRYRLLESTAASGGYTKIATAHNSDDVVETIMMRIFTGTGIHGLSGIPPRRGKVIRPILCVSSSDIHEYLRAHSIEWREDLTNRDTAYSRNFLRNTIIPMVEERFPMASRAVLSLGEVSGDTISLLNSLIAERYPDLFQYFADALHIDADRIGHDQALLSHAISSAVRDRMGGYVDRNMLRIISSGYKKEKSNSLLFENRHLVFEKIHLYNKCWIRIKPAAPKEKPVSKWEYRIDLTEKMDNEMDLPEAGITVRLMKSDYKHFLDSMMNPRTVFVTLRNDTRSLYIRNRRSGDMIATDGGTKRIKDLLIEKKFNQVSKNRVPLLTDGVRILAFMPGLLFETTSRISRDFLVDKNSEKVLAVFTKPRL